jgi:adenosylcobyric acid synthase
VRGAAALMIQGTGSDVGKSLVVAGLARAFARRGLAVRPFKPQNMSNNAAVTQDGGEIGRAQALQARAAFVAPTAAMNPVLLKPQGETGAQLVIEGRVAGTATASQYRDLKRDLLPRVLQSFATLAAEADIVLVEGAGSPAEINLRAGDIANMGFATAARVPVVIVGDIDRGGVIASLVGTHALLAPDERALLKGYIVNKFRGDPSLFTPALAEIAQRTGLSCLGIVPWFAAARDLPAEDSLALETQPPRRRPGALLIAVPRLPRIANFDDLDPLASEPGVVLDLVPPGRALPPCDLVLLPGSKATRADLAVLRQEGWDIDILAHARKGGAVLGICGGCQLLGRTIADPAGIEGPPGTSQGLGLLAIDTVLEGAKILRPARGTHVPTGASVAGYEMHMGRIAGPDAARPMLRLESGDDGALSRDRRIAGCHLHGLFAGDQFRRAFLAALGGAGDDALVWEARIDSALDALADHVAAALDLDRLLEIARAR